MPVPPKSVQEVARRALERRRELPPSRRGGTAVGVARARSLANGQNLPIETIKRMTSFFARHDTKTPFYISLISVLLSEISIIFSSISKLGASVVSLI